jgi:hypothetical protein
MYRIRKDKCTLSEFLGVEIEVPTPPVAPYAFALVGMDDAPCALVLRCRIDPHMRPIVERFINSINAVDGTRVLYQCSALRSHARENGRIVVMKTGCDVGEAIKQIERI